MIELLESRIAPALTVTLLHGTLTVEGDPNGPVNIRDTGSGAIQVFDNSSPFHEVTGVKQIVVRFAQDNDELTLNFQFGYSGSVKVDSGEGNNMMTVLNGPG